MPGRRNFLLLISLVWVTTNRNLRCQPRQSAQNVPTKCAFRSAQWHILGNFISASEGRKRLRQSLKCPQYAPLYKHVVQL